MPSENSKSVKVLDELFQKLSVSKEAAEVKESSGALASFVNGPIEDQAVPTRYVAIEEMVSPLVCHIAAMPRHFVTATGSRGEIGTGVALEPPCLKVIYQTLISPLVLCLTLSRLLCRLLLLDEGCPAGIPNGPNPVPLSGECFFFSLRDSVGVATWQPGPSPSARGGAIVDFTYRLIRSNKKMMELLTNALLLAA